MTILESQHRLSGVKLPQAEMHTVWYCVLGTDKYLDVVSPNLHQHSNFVEVERPRSLLTARKTYD